MEILFWLLFAAVAYPYLIYPLVVWVLARWFGRHDQPPPLDAGSLPTVTLLICAHNESKLIGARIENALATEYPKDKLNVVIASDGSTDDTATIVERYADRGV